MNSSGNNLDFLDVLTILSIMLQIMGYRNDMSQSSNDDLMRELQRQDKAYLEKIIENQNKILEKLADLQADILWGMPIGMPHIDFQEVKI